MELRAIPESDLVRNFLQDIFKPSGDALFISPAQLHWKCWEPHPFWTGSRSYGFLDDAGNLTAHACAWPFNLRTTEGTLTGVHPIDWAANPKARGAGAQLLKQVRVLRDICCCTGGTDIAQVVVRQSGFKPAATMQMLARPLRPLRQALTHQRRNWKLPARLLRNTAWIMNGISHPAGWTAWQIQPSELPDAVLPTPSANQAVGVRSAALFEYLAKCPSARYELWRISYGGEPRGYFLLSFVPGQARIADAWVSDGNWSALYALAIKVAFQERSSAEIVTGATLAEALQGAQACGFRPSGECTVMLYDPHSKLKNIHWQMIDNDSSFLHDNHIEYVT